MIKARVFVHGMEAGILEKCDEGKKYQFTYHDDYQGAPVSLTMPLQNKLYSFDFFPPFFEGLLPEGVMLEALLRKYKLDKNDYFAQLIQVGQDLVGAVTIEALE